LIVGCVPQAEQREARTVIWMPGWEAGGVVDLCRSERFQKHITTCWSKNILNTSTHLQMHIFGWHIANM